MMTASLAHALREGLDPDGQPLIAPMPRYELDERSLCPPWRPICGVSARRPPLVSSPTACIWRRS